MWKDEDVTERLASAPPINTTWALIIETKLLQQRFAQLFQRPINFASFCEAEFSPPTKLVFITNKANSRHQQGQYPNHVFQIPIPLTVSLIRVKQQSRHLVRKKAPSYLVCCDGTHLRNSQLLCLLLIVKLTPDLASLRNFDLASSAVAALFDECGVEITTAILASSVFISEGVRGLIQTVTTIRSNLVLSKSLDEFLQSYIHRDAPCKDILRGSVCARRRCVLSIEDSPDPYSRCYRTCRPAQIPASTPVPVLRGILSLVTQIDNFTSHCVQKMLERCMALKPSRIKDRFFHYKYHPFEGRCPQRRPEGELYELKDFGPPS